MYEFKFDVVAFMRVHGLRVQSPKSLLHTARAAEPRHIVAGVGFHGSPEERRFQRERFVGRAWFILAVSTQARRCTQRRIWFSN